MNRHTDAPWMMFSTPCCPQAQIKYLRKVVVYCWKLSKLIKKNKFEGESAVPFPTAAFNYSQLKKSSAIATMRTWLQPSFTIRQQLRVPQLMCGINGKNDRFCSKAHVSNIISTINRWTEGTLYYMLDGNHSKLLSSYRPTTLVFHGCPSL
jgi:hypothetical protein